MFKDMLDDMDAKKYEQHYQNLAKMDEEKKSMSKNRGSPFSKFVHNLVFILLFKL
mgnify:CR=1 FL=1